VTGREGSGWRVAIGSDPAGAGHLAALTADLRTSPLVGQVIEPGRGRTPAYPDAALAAAELVAAGRADRALLVCHTGLGMCVAANKVLGIRAVTAHDAYSVDHAIRYTNAQVLCLGQAIVPLALACELVQLWLNLRFDPRSKAAHKLALIAAYERDHRPPA